MDNTTLDLEPAIAAHVIDNWYPKVKEYPCIFLTKEADLLSKGETTHVFIKFDCGYKAIFSAHVPVNGYLFHQINYQKELNND
jgi:hypothetical protein